MVAGLQLGFGEGVVVEGPEGDGAGFDGVEACCGRGLVDEGVGFVDCLACSAVETGGLGEFLTGGWTYCLSSRGSHATEEESESESESESARVPSYSLQGEGGRFSHVSEGILTCATETYTSWTS